MRKTAQFVLCSFGVLFLLLIILFLVSHGRTGNRTTLILATIAANMITARLFGKDDPE